MCRGFICYSTSIFETSMRHWYNHFLGIKLYVYIYTYDKMGISWGYNSIYLGKLEYFTNLNCWAIKGDDFPIKTMIPGFGRSEVVIVYQYIYIHIYIYTYIYIYSIHIYIYIYIVYICIYIYVHIGRKIMINQWILGVASTRRRFLSHWKMGCTLSCRGSLRTGKSPCDG